MKITRIRICKTGLPYVGGAYVWGAGNAIEVAHASVVVIDTDAGLQGCGEFTPCGENYMAAHSEGAPMYRVAPQKAADETLAEMQRCRADGYKQFQIKVGGDWAGDIDRIKAGVALLESGEKAMADANQGWRVDNAVRVARATRNLDYILEQPCRTYEECQQVRRVAEQPMKLDECVTGMAAAQRIAADRGAEICCLKISNLGGLSKARRVRDFLVENRIPVVSEDTWGGEITSTAVAHFAASTPSEYLQNTTDLMNYNTRSTGLGGAWADGGKLYAPDAPGLGVAPDFNSLGAPIAEYAL